MEKKRKASKQWLFYTPWEKIEISGGCTVGYLFLMLLGVVEDELYDSFGLLLGPGGRGCANGVHCLYEDGGQGGRLYCTKGCSMC